MASTMDTSILKELFGYYLKICNILGIEGETVDVKRVLSKLPPFKTGSFDRSGNGSWIIRKQRSITVMYPIYMAFIQET